MLLKLPPQDRWLRSDGVAHDEVSLDDPRNKLEVVVAEVVVVAEEKGPRQPSEGRALVVQHRRAALALPRHEVRNEGEVRRARHHDLDHAHPRVVAALQGLLHSVGRRRCDVLRGRLHPPQVHRHQLEERLAVHRNLHAILAVCSSWDDRKQKKKETDSKIIQ